MFSVHFTPPPLQIPCTRGKLHPRSKLSDLKGGRWPWTERKAPAQRLCQRDTHRHRKSRRNGVTGGTKPSSSWLWWERSSDLGMFGGSPTCATETAEVIFYAAAVAPRILSMGQLLDLKKTQRLSVYFCRCVLHPIPVVHGNMRNPTILPWDCLRTIHQPGGNHVLEKDLSAFPG